MCASRRHRVDGDARHGDGGVGLGHGVSRVERRGMRSTTTSARARSGARRRAGRCRTPSPRPRGRGGSRRVRSRASQPMLETIAPSRPGRAALAGRSPARAPDTGRASRARCSRIPRCSRRPMTTGAACAVVMAKRHRDSVGDAQGTQPACSNLATSCPARSVVNTRAGRCRDCDRTAEPSATNSRLSLPRSDTDSRTPTTPSAPIAVASSVIRAKAVP